jgi:hypothetical protein
VQNLGPEPGVAADLEEAFPCRLRADVRAALKVLPPAEHRPASPFRVLLSGEVVAIPYRIYAAEPSPDRQEAQLPIQRAVIDCLYTRHHDGWVRQRRLERVIGLVEPWVTPFVVQLIGEYVEEILLVVQRNLPWACRCRQRGGQRLWRVCPVQPNVAPATDPGLRRATPI